MVARRELIGHHKGVLGRGARPQAGRRLDVRVGKLSGPPHRMREERTAGRLQQTSEEHTEGARGGSPGAQTPGQGARMTDVETNVAD